MRQSTIDKVRQVHALDENFAVVSPKIQRKKERATRTDNLRLIYPCGSPLHCITTLHCLAFHYLASYGLVRPITIGGWSAAGWTSTPEGPSGDYDWCGTPSVGVSRACTSQVSRGIRRNERGRGEWLCRFAIGGREGTGRGGLRSVFGKYSTGTVKCSNGILGACVSL